jgi:hypothetical protein
VSYPAPVIFSDEAVACNERLVPPSLLRAETRPRRRYFRHETNPRGDMEVAISREPVRRQDVDPRTDEIDLPPPTLEDRRQAPDMDGAEPLGAVGVTRLLACVNEPTDEIVRPLRSTCYEHTAVRTPVDGQLESSQEMVADARDRGRERSHRCVHGGRKIE